jgi:integrase
MCVSDRRTRSLPPGFRSECPVKAPLRRGFSLGAEHERQLGGASPLPSLMVAKGWRSARRHREVARAPCDGALRGGRDNALRVGHRRGEDRRAGLGQGDALRPTNASQLIDAGIDVLTISKRVGHASPAITLKIYAHLFRGDDGEAAAAINARGGGVALSGPGKN